MMRFWTRSGEVDERSVLEIKTLGGNEDDEVGPLDVGPYLDC